MTDPPHISTTNSQSELKTIAKIGAGSGD